MNEPIETTDIAAIRDMVAAHLVVVDEVLKQTGIVS